MSSSSLVEVLIKQRISGASSFAAIILGYLMLGGMICFYRRLSCSLASFRCGSFFILASFGLVWLLSPASSLSRDLICCSTCWSILVFISSLCSPNATSASAAWSISYNRGVSDRNRFGELHQPLHKLQYLSSSSSSPSSAA